MNKTERIKLVKAMEMLARAVNDESVFMEWLTLGVADGDAENDDLEYYTEDDVFADLMDVFLDTMSDARKSGGLYFDNVLSKEG